MHDNCKEDMSVGNITQSVGKLEMLTLGKSLIMSFTAVEKCCIS